MTLNRRQLLVHGAALLLGAPALTRAAGAADTAVRTALDTSPLIYLTPLQKDGRESSCQAEVWFVPHEGDVYVSTATGAWRAVAVTRGLTRARIWVGDFGVWKRAKEAYRAAPTTLVEGRLETDAARQAQVLERFGGKYVAEWDKWGPRFRDGLADGSRVLLRYSLVS
ncbi:MAG: hypothetical protein AB7O21_06450 [Gammaproteobacteria bacterium]